MVSTHHRVSANAYILRRPVLRFSTSSSNIFQWTRFPHSICKPGCMFRGMRLLFMRKFPWVKPCLTNYAYTVYAPRYVAPSVSRIIIHSVHFNFRRTSMYASHELNCARDMLNRTKISRIYSDDFRYLSEISMIIWYQIEKERERK